MTMIDVQSNYYSQVEAGTETIVRETEKQTKSNRTAKEYEKYLKSNYDGLQKNKDATVTIDPKLLSKAATDEKTSRWLEYNLKLIPDLIDSTYENAARNGARVISCNISFDGYDSMTAQVYAVFEADPGTEEAKKLLEEARAKNKERSEQQEKIVEKNNEKKQLAERLKGVQAKTFVTDGVESLMSKVKDTNFYDESNAISIDVRG